MGRSFLQGVLASIFISQMMTSVWGADDVRTISSDAFYSALSTGEDRKLVIQSNASDGSIPEATFDGVISGYTGFTVGDGTKPIRAILNQINTYTGPTTVNDGAILKQGLSGALPVGGLALNGGTLEFDANFDGMGTFDKDISLSGRGGLLQTSGWGGYLLNSHISGSGGLVISRGIIQLNYSCTYSGGTKIEHNATLAVDMRNLPENGLLTLSGGTLLANGIYSGPVILTDNTRSEIIDCIFSGGITGSGGLSIGSSELSTTIFMGEASYSYSGPTHVYGNFEVSVPSLSSSEIIGYGGQITFKAAAGTYANPLSGDGIVNVPSGANWRLSGGISGGLQVQVERGGSLILDGTQSYTGATIISGGSSLGFTSANSPLSYTSGVTFGTGGGTLDLSGMGGGSPVFTTGGITASRAATIKTIIGSGSADCPVIDVKGTAIFLPSLNLEFVLADAPSSYAEGQYDYTLFMNAAEDSIVSLGTSITGLPSGLTASLEPLSNGNLKFKLVKSSAKNTHTVSGGHGATQNVSNTVNSVTSHHLSDSRDESVGGNADGGSSGSFRKNPFQAPNLTNDFLNVTDRALAHATEDTRRFWSPARTEKTAVWVQPFGMTLRQGTEESIPGYKTRTAGVLAGFDHKFRYDIIGGVALGYARTKQNFEDNAGHGNVKDRFLSFFGTWFRGPWYVEGSLLMGLETYQGVRNTGINNTFVSNHHGGYEFSPHVGGGYTFDLKGFKLKGFANLDFAYSAQYGYQETGTNGIYWSQSSASMLRTEVGGELSHTYEFTNVNWRPVLSLSGVNKRPLRKGTIVSPTAGSFKSTQKTTTNISPGIASTWQFNDGYSFSAAWMGEFGSQYNLQEVFLKFSKKL